MSTNVLTLAIISFVSLAVLAECARQAPEMDNYGRIVGPSLRDRQRGN